MCVYLCARLLKIHLWSHENIHLITFGLLQADKASALLLIKPSLAKVADWETGTVDERLHAHACVFVHNVLCVCVFFSVLCPLGQR